MNLIAPYPIRSNNQMDHLWPRLEKPVVSDREIVGRTRMRVPRCYRPILQIFHRKCKGVFRSFRAVLNLDNAEVHIDHAAPLNVRIPEPAQLLLESQEIGIRQH